MTGHRNEHLFPPGWEPPAEPVCGAAVTAVLAVVATVAIALVLAATAVVVAWVWVEAAKAGGLP
jgi:hypothetical protein